MSLNMFYYQERSRKAVDLKYCAVFTHSAQFRGFIWPFFLKYNMSKFTFWGELLISWEIFVLKHAVLPRKGPKCSWILNIVQFGPILLNSDGLFGHFLEL